MPVTCTIPAGGYELPVTVHTPPEVVDRHVAVLYLHGGGLLYGERDDLPAPYLRAFLNKGYTLYCMDYPLAPEVSLSGIHDAILAGWSYLMREDLPKRGIGRYFLFGRSAGAYLALLLAKHLRTGTQLPSPVGILDFYGYYDMREAAFSAPASYYTALPAVPEQVAKNIIGKEPITTGPKAQRFSLYVYARQQGLWTALLGAQDAASSEASLSGEDIAQLPPLFITASSADQDVPFRISKTLSRQAPNAVMKPVYYLEHDFDRDTANPAGMQVYTACLNWMESLL